MATPKASDLRERVAFGTRAVVADEYGNPVSGDFADEFTVAARIMPLRGSEQVMASRLSGVQPVVIQVRYSSDTARITPGWQARDVRKGTVFNITGAANMDEKRQFIDVLATAGEATG